MFFDEPIEEGALSQSFNEDLDVPQLSEECGVGQSPSELFHEFS